MAAIYISVYAAQAQWAELSPNLISTQPNLILNSFDENRIYFGNGTIGGGSFLQYIRESAPEAGANMYGLQIQLQNALRFKISNDILGNKFTNLEPSATGRVNIGIVGSSAAQLYMNGSIVFSDNTTLNSANFITTITSQQSRITQSETQLIALNSSLSGIFTKLNYCGNTTICGNVDINGGSIKLGSIDGAIYRYCYNNYYNSGGKNYTGPAECIENNIPNYINPSIANNTPTRGIYLANRTVLSPKTGTITNSNQGITIGQTTATSIIITPQGSLKFKDGSEIGTANGLISIKGATGESSPWVLDGANMRFSTGKVWIGNRRPTTGIHSNYRLAVDGKIVSNEIFTLPTADAAWADDVFNPNYKLKTLSETETYITKNHHLDGIPSEAEVKQNGIDIGSMDAKLLRKIEEQYLHLIRMQKELNALKNELNQLKK